MPLTTQVMPLRGGAARDCRRALSRRNLPLPGLPQAPGRDLPQLRSLRRECGDGHRRDARIQEPILLSDFRLVAV